MADDAFITPPANLKVSPYFVDRLAEWRRVVALIERLSAEESATPLTDAQERQAQWSKINLLIDLHDEIKAEVHAAPAQSAIDLAIKTDILLREGLVNWEFHDGIKAEASRLVGKMFPAHN